MVPATLTHPNLCFFLVTAHFSGKAPRAVASFSAAGGFDLVTLWCFSSSVSVCVLPVYLWPASHASQW